MIILLGSVRSCNSTNNSVLPTTFTLHKQCTHPGVRREPGISGRKLSVGATLDIGR